MKNDVQKIIVVHLITQRNQPYGSVRVCCENCGAYGSIFVDCVEKYVDTEEKYNSLPKQYIRCNEKNK